MPDPKLTREAGVLLARLADATGRTPDDVLSVAVELAHQVAVLDELAQIKSRDAGLTDAQQRVMGLVRANMAVSVGALRRPGPPVAPPNPGSPTLN